jgi:hypothetical protein
MLQKRATLDIEEIKTMKADKINSKRLFVTAIILLMLVACAKPYHFFVKYDLPASSSQLEGQKVYLQVRDNRDSKIFLSEKARNEFALWDDRFALYHTPKKPKGHIETYSLSGLIETAMKMRLENMGITIIENKTDGIPFFEVILHKFSLDLDDRTWVSDFNYEVKLAQNHQKTSREMVSGQAERTKIMGRGAGEVLVGDIFTESINKLNIEQLFKNAGI